MHEKIIDLHSSVNGNIEKQLIDFFNNFSGTANKVNYKLDIELFKPLNVEVIFNFFLFQ